MIKHASELTVASQAFIDAITHGSRRPANAATPTPPPTPTASTTASLGLLQACLDRLDPDLPYPDWFRVAAAVFYATSGSENGFALFDSWSANGRKYEGERETRAIWKYLRLDHARPVTIATLRYMLEADGHDWMDICGDAEPSFEALDGEGE